MIRVSLLVDETPRGGIYDNHVPFGRSVFSQINGDKRQSLPAFVVFQMPTDKNNQSDICWGGGSETPTVIFWDGMFYYPSVGKSQGDKDRAPPQMCPLIHHHVLA